MLQAYVKGENWQSMTIVQMHKQQQEASVKAVTLVSNFLVMERVYK